MLAFDARSEIGPSVTAQMCRPLQADHSLIRLGVGAFTTGYVTPDVISRIRGIRSRNTAIDLFTLMAEAAILERRDMKVGSFLTDRITKSPEEIFDRMRDAANQGRILDIAGQALTLHQRVWRIDHQPMDGSISPSTVAEFFREGLICNFNLDMQEQRFPKAQIDEARALLVEETIFAMRLSLFN